MFGKRDLHAQMKKVLLLHFYRFVLHWGMNLECIPEHRVHLTLRGRNSFYMHPRGIKCISNASFFHADDNKIIKLAEYKLTRSELFVEHSKKTPSLKSASFSTRRFAGYAYSFEVAWRSNLGDHSRDRTRACKTREFHCHPLEPGKYATEIRGPRLLQINFSHTHNFGKLNWPRKVDRNGGCDSCERPLVVLVKALIGQSLQPLDPNSRSVTFWGIQKHDTVSTNGEHLRVAEVKDFQPYQNQWDPSIETKALISLTVFETKNEMRVHTRFARTCNIFRVTGVIVRMPYLPSWKVRWDNLICRLSPGFSSFSNLLQGYSICRFRCDCPLCWWYAVVSPNMSRIQIFPLLSTPSWPGCSIVLGHWSERLLQRSEICRLLAWSSSQSWPSPSRWCCHPAAHWNASSWCCSLCGSAMEQSYRLSTLCYCWLVYLCQKLAN